MSFLSRLFGGAKPDPEPPQPEMHDGFAIYPEPVREGAHWRIAARIEKEVGGAHRVHRLIRADTIEDREAAVSASLAKARQMIDEQGERIFG